MKLLFDQNISARLMTDLADLYPESKHVRNIGMASADDVEIWEYAREHGAIIVSKDSDFYHRSMLLGHPPKVVWLKIGNCTTAQIKDLLRLRHADLVFFSQDSQTSFLALK